jgi:hypothetical protein
VNQTRGYEPFSFSVRSSYGAVYGNPAIEPKPAEGKQRKNMPAG